MKRRELLRGVLGVGSVALAGCQSVGDPETEPTVPRSSADGTDSKEASPEPKSVSPSVLPDGIPSIPDGFDSVVNVAAAGADTSGEVPINDVLDEHLTDGTLLVFPSGQYRVSKLTIEGLENAGLIAAAGASPVLIPDSPASDQGPRWLWLSEVGQFLFDGFTVDFRDEERSGRIMVTGTGDFAVRNLDVRGRYVTPSAFRFDVRDPDHSALVENLRAFGAAPSRKDTTGIYVGRLHAGEIVIRNCRLENFPDNGVYASAPGGHGGSYEGKDGIVHVDGGTFKNNNVANVRLGSTGSTVRDVDIVVDEVPPHPPDELNVRGIRLRGKRDQLVENCSVRFGPDAGNGFGAIVLHEDNGPATIRDTEIRMDRDGVPAIRAAEPSAAVTEDQNGPAGPRLQNVRIEGNAGEETTVEIMGRDETTFEGCAISQGGADRDGMTFRRSEECLVDGTTVDVSGQPFVLDEATVTRRDNTIAARTTTSDGTPSPTE